MSRKDPKLIINIPITDEKLDKHIEDGIDRYTQRYIHERLDRIVQSIVDRKIEAILKGNSWSFDARIDGISLERYVKEKTKNTIEKYVKDNIDDILGAQLLKLVKGQVDESIKN